MKLRGSLAALLCAVAALPAMAAETWYEVELIIVAQRKPDAGSEIWPVKALPPVTQEASLTIPGPGQAGVSGKIAPLPPENLRLQAEAQRIATDNNYELLLHTGWRQPGLPREQSLPVRIQAVEAVPADGMGYAMDAEAAPRLDGTVRLILARYLHLEADLRYRDAAPANDAGLFDGFGAQAAEAPVYRLNESRRMRSREVHYLDHPMFGIIATVTPYELPAAAPAPRPAAPVAVPAPGTGTGTSGTIKRN